MATCADRFGSRWLLVLVVVVPFAAQCPLLCHLSGKCNATDASVEGARPRWLPAKAKDKTAGAGGRTPAFAHAPTANGLAGVQEEKDCREGFAGELVGRRHLARAAEEGK